MLKQYYFIHSFNDCVYSLIWLLTLKYTIKYSAKTTLIIKAKVRKLTLASPRRQA